MGRTILIYAEAMQWGGVSSAFIVFADELERLGYKVKVILPYRTDIERAVIPHRYICGWAWQRRVKSRLLRRVLNLINLLTDWRLYFLFVPKYEHDIFINYFAWENFYWSRYSRKPSCAFLHNAMSFRPQGGWRDALWSRRGASWASAYSRIIAITDAAADFWYMRVGLFRRPDVIPNFLDIDGILEKGRGGCADAVLRPGVKHFVFVGRFAQVKGVDRLLEAVRKLKGIGLDFDLNLVGDGPLSAWMHDYCEVHDLGRQVHFLGHKDNPYPYMKASDLLICSSYSEGEPLIFAEALLMRCPIMTMDFGNAKTRLGNGTWGAVVDGTVVALVNGLRKFILGEISCLPAEGFSAVEQLIRRKDLLGRKQMKRCLEQIVNGGEK